MVWRSGAIAKFNRIESLALAQLGNIVGKWGAIAKANTALHRTQVRLGLRLRPLSPVNSAVGLLKLLVGQYFKFVG